MFCFLGQDAKGGDMPPQWECSLSWRMRLMTLMPLDVVLTIDQYAQCWQMGAVLSTSLTETAADLDGPSAFVLAVCAAFSTFDLAQYQLDQTESVARNGIATFSQGGNLTSLFLGVMEVDT